jgi:hypothetical protein
MHPVELFGEDWLEWSTRDRAAIGPQDVDPHRS